MASPPDRFIAWCKQEQVSVEQQLELMQAGKVRLEKTSGRDRATLQPLIEASGGRC